jgi:uncharacterized protein YndB with AHSA1/START domain
MTQAFANTNAVIDRDSRTIILTRVFATARERVFEAWTRPEHVKCWWDPAGEPLAKCEIDLRPGGAFRFVNRHSPDSQQFAGVYLEIAPPRHLFFEAMGAIGRVILDETDGKTLLTVRIECNSTDQLEQFLKIGIDTGTAKTLDHLVDYVGAMPSRAPSGRSDIPTGR